MNFATTLKNKIIERAKMVADKTLTDDTTIKERVDICNQCEFRFKPTNQCLKCGCLLKTKTSFASSSCPIGKWESANPRGSVSAI